MYTIFVLIAVVVVAAIAGFFLIGPGKRFAQRHNEVHEELHEDRTPTLEYAVPVGQDPTVVLAALEQAGFTATSDPSHPQQTVLIACPAGVDAQREGVRRVIESAGVTTPQDGARVPDRVQFRDEA